MDLLNLAFRLLPLYVSFVLPQLSLSLSLPDLKVQYPIRLSTAPQNESHDLLPAVGFALGVDAATAAILYPDDTITVLGPLSVSEEYRQVLRRLNNQSSVHVHPPYKYFDGFSLRELLRRASRSLRRTLSLPSSSDVGVLAQPLWQLHELVAAELGYPPDSGVLITPAIRAVYDEDVVDMMTYSRMRQLPTRTYESDGCEAPHDLIAAFAGRGQGLCPTYWNATQCQREEEEALGRAGEKVLLVSVTDHSLSISHSLPLRSPLSQSLGFHSVTFGFVPPLPPPNPSDPDRHDRIARATLRSNLWRGHWGPRNITQLHFTYAPAALDPPLRDDFESFVFHLVVDGQSEENGGSGTVPTVFSGKAEGETVFATARGAAEMARRAKFFENGESGGIPWSLVQAKKARTRKAEMTAAAAVAPDPLRCYGWEAIDLEWEMDA